MKRGASTRGTLDEQRRKSPGDLRGDAPTGLDKNRVRQELSRALDLWARNSKLTFQEVNSEHADILISFQRVRESHGNLIYGIP
ncbi:hypothetical protein PV326_013693 [Microctonus aethiopoides]|nr:hypothetical protein PV326_013693 [Microctonus aethiopoides]